MNFEIFMKKLLLLLDSSGSDVILAEKEPPVIPKICVKFFSVNFSLLFKIGTETFDLGIICK